MWSPYSSIFDLDAVVYMTRKRQLNSTTSKLTSFFLSSTGTNICNQDISLRMALYHREFGLFQIQEGIILFMYLFLASWCIFSILLIRCLLRCNVQSKILFKSRYSISIAPGCTTNSPIWNRYLSVAEGEREKLSSYAGIKVHEIKCEVYFQSII